MQHLIAAPEAQFPTQPTENAFDSLRHGTPWTLGPELTTLARAELQIVDDRVNSRGLYVRVCGKVKVR